MPSNSDWMWNLNCRGWYIRLRRSGTGLAVLLPTWTSLVDF